MAHGRVSAQSKGRVVTESQKTRPEEFIVSTPELRRKRGVGRNSGRKVGGPDNGPLAVPGDRVPWATSSHGWMFWASKH